MARSKEQIDQLKSLVDQLRSEGLSTEQIQAKVDEQKAVFDAEQPTTTEVTEEIQEPVTEGKTNDTVETGASAVSETGQAPESTESDLEDGSLELYGNYRDAITLTPEEQAVLDNPIDFTPKGIGRELQPYNPETGENLIKTIFDERFQDPTTGQFFEEAEITYRPDVTQSGDPLPAFQPYQKELDSARKQLIENGVKNPSEDQVQELAEKQIKKLFKYEKIKEKSKSFLEGISEKEREQLIPYAVDDFITLDNKFKNLNEQYAALFNKYKKSPNAFNLKNISSKFENSDYSFDLKGLKSVKDADVYLNRIKDLGDPENFMTKSTVDLYNSLVNKYAQAVEQAETVVLNNGKEVPKATFNLYKDLIDENKEVSETLSELNNEINEIPLALQDAETELDFLKKNYSSWQKAGGNVQLQLGKILPSLIGGASKVVTDTSQIILNNILSAGGLDENVSSVVSSVVTGPAFNPMTEGLNNIADFTDDLIVKAEDQYRKKYKDDVKFEEAFNSWKNFGEFVLQETAGQAGTFAMLASGQVPGAIGLGISSYDDTRRMLEEEAELLGTEESTAHKASVALGYAAAEVGLGFLPSARIFKRGFDAAEQLGKRNLVNEGIKQSIKKGITRTFIYDPVIESSTEGGTQLIQNLIDIQRGKEGVGIFDNVAHAAFTGGMLGTTFSSIPAVKGIVLANLSDYNSYEGFRKNLNEINRLTEIGNFLDKRTKEYKIIKKQISDLNESNNDIITQVEQKVSANLTAEGFDLFTKATSEQESLRVQAKAIIESKDLSKKQKNIALEAIKKKFDFYQQARDSFRKDYKVNIDLLPTKERNRYVDMAKVELEQEGGEFTNAQLKQRAEKLWQIETFDKNVEQDIKANKVIREAGIDENVVIAKTKADAIKAYKEAMEARAADPNNSITEEEAKQNIANFTRGVNSGRVNGSNTQGVNNKTGKATYDKIIVRENAINNGRTQTGLHETGHTLLTEGLSSNPEAFQGIADVVLEHLKNTNESAYNRILKRSKGKGADEVLTEFLEEVGSKRLDLEAAQNKKLLGFLSIGIPKVFKNITKDQSNFNLKGETDVVEFLESLGTKLREGTLTVEDIQAIQKGKPQEEQVVAKQDFSQEASQRVQEIYNNQGEAGAFDIIEQFKPITSKLVERRREAPGFDRQLLTDEIETGQRGILDLIKEYNPDSGVPLAAYINKFLPARAIEASKRVLGEEFTEDVSEARGIAAEEVSVDETPTKPEVKAIDPFRVMPNVKETATAEVQKNITDKGVDVTEVTYKELKDVAPYQTVADFFNIPVSRIKNPKDNLRKSDDVANIQRWILKNEPTLKNLFTEANREVVEIKEGNRVVRKGGEPTAIPRNLLNKFYNKGERVGNNFQWTLKPYDRNTFLESVGIKDGKVDPNFTPRAAEAQTIKGILDMYTRNLGNVAARDIIETKEDIAPAEKARAKAEVAKGKPRLMFSEEVLTEVTGARDINAVAKILNISKITVNDNNRVEKQKQMEEAIVAAKIPSWMFEGSKFGAPGRRKVNGVYVDLPNRGGLYYGSEDIAYQKALALAKQNDSLYDIKPPKRVPAKKANTEKMKQRSKDNLEALDFFGTKLADAVAKKQMPLELAALFITSGYQATYGIIKIAAPFRYFSKNPQFSTNPKAKANQRAEGKGEKFREEHNPPASVIGATLIYGIATNNMSSVMPNIKKNYYQTNLSKADDFKLDDANLDATLPAGTTIADNPAIRLIEAGIDLNSIVNYETGQTMAEELGVALKPSDVNVQTVFEQNKILKQVLNGDITAKTGQNRLDKISKLKSVPKASVNNNNENNTIKFSEQVPNEQVLDNLNNADAAMANARNADAPVKKIRVFDFDDTLAKSNSQVLYELPDGTTGKLNATQFAERSAELQEQGAEFDFSEFSKVIDGKKGPVFKAIENIVAKRGAEDVFILTARPANAAGPIKEFMDALGVNLPIKNIVGLGDGTAEAKARWMTGKAAEGYNDFFFVDDAYKNVKAVQDALDVFDVKSKTQQAKVKFSKEADLDQGFNDIIEQTTGIASEKEYKRVKAEVAGAARGRVFRGIPYSAQDLVGLLYETLGKGKLGDAQMAWWKTHLLDPYARAMNDLDNARLSMMQDYRALKKQLGLVPKNLRKKIPGEPFTREQAVRVYIWNKQGMEVPGISKSDLKDLTDFVENDAELQVFADQLVAIQKGDQYAKPKEGWPAGSITTDLLESINTVKRAKYLEQWKANKDVIFSEKNLNKLEAAYGKKYRVAMENMLGRMETGRNRSFSDDSLTGRFTDWLQGSVGAIMFFNTRSALLQTISAINFVNFTDNNPLSAAKAFANQKQYWSDFTKLINSDFLKARRSGLRMNVNEADIADMAKKGGPKAVINKLLQLGFAPTQIADSFAIASGGATFYRNRVKTYTKQGLSQQEAETKAFEDFRENAEESQQSARPDRISMQQAGGLGRLILAFQNTPSQYARIIDKSIRDLKNGRGDAKTNISKIVYYSTVQNLLFNAIQQALFAFAFDDEEPEDEKKKEKYFDIANGMSDSLLRGTGLAGGVLSVVKNAIIRIVEESEKDKPKFEKVGADLLKIAPPVSSKLSKINQAARSYQWDKEEMKEKGWSLDNPAYLAAANVISATTNIPVDRGIKKINNVVGATDSDLETWERLALLGGWQDWELNIEDENKTNKPQPRKTNKGKRKRETRKTEKR